MSYDLAIATRTRPKPDAIAAFGRAKGVDMRTLGMFKPAIRITYVQPPPSEPAEAIPWID
jgi:hypothetical protein